MLHKIRKKSAFLWILHGPQCPRSHGDGRRVATEGELEGELLLFLVQ